MGLKKKIADFVLWNIITYANNLRKDNIDFSVNIVIDEIQNYNIMNNSAIKYLFTMGSHSNLSCIFTTQYMNRDVNKGEVEQILGQAATRIYFKPAPKDIKLIASLLPNIDGVDVKNELKNLKKGQCIIDGAYKLTKNNLVIAVD